MDREHFDAALVAEHGWPGRSLVGKDGATAAWLLVQHADADRAFQEQCLALMEAAVAAGEAEPSELAYPTDRVRCGAGLPQRYGTQMREHEGRYIPQPIEDEANVDARRAAVGLGPQSWPAELIQFAEQQWGSITSIRPLAGLSGARVWQLAAGDHRAVVKQCGPNEASFYQWAAPRLREAGVGTPELWWAGEDPAGEWLVLEYLPAAPDRATWLAHPAPMTALARLHQHPPAVFAGLRAPYRPRWDEALVDAALGLVAPPRRRQLRAHLSAIGHEIATLQREERPISGDPNPANWGLRADGTVALFDWERAGFGPPAFDLAITIPGLAELAAAWQVAHAYLAAGGVPPPHSSIAGLARKILVCKVWVVVEFMATIIQQGVTLDPSYDELWRGIPSRVGDTALSWSSPQLDISTQGIGEL